jgi:hypothetical protein
MEDIFHGGKPMKVAVLMALNLVLQPAAAANGFSCEASPKQHAVRLSGEIAGQHAFAHRVGENWWFKLEPAQYGWDLRLRDKDGMDLSQITPPFHLTPNPREIYGWHFRNKTNTATNTGEVNAPQKERLFYFSPSLSGSGGLRPPQHQTVAAHTPAGPETGRGWLQIQDMGLADLDKGRNARMNYLKFRVCLSWPKTAEESLGASDLEDPTYREEELEVIFGCGLDASLYEPSAWILPRMLSGDLDGDDSHDHATPIVRKSDGKRGISICRARTWNTVIGYAPGSDIPLKTEGGEPQSETYFSLAGYLNRTETWEMQNAENTRDRIILRRVEKAELALQWDGKKFTHELLWVHVEP